MPPIRSQTSLLTYSPYDLEPTTLDPSYTVEKENENSPHLLDKKVDELSLDPFGYNPLDASVIENLGLPSPPMLSMPDFCTTFDKNLSGLSITLPDSPLFGYSLDDCLSEFSRYGPMADNSYAPDKSPSLSDFSIPLSSQSHVSPESDFGDFDGPLMSPSLSYNSNYHLADSRATPQEIKSFMGGPDANGKYVCLYEQCGKLFGRRYNIQSHIQTHLADRPFKCNHCDACFVRAHDLRRHVRIHDVVKPHLCPCGKGFSRMDALTRHRMRAICIGALPGYVRKNGKRGRPRKDQRDDDGTAMVPLNKVPYTPPSPVETFWNLEESDDLFA